MARCKNAVSNIGIRLADLLSVLGPSYNGEIVISKAWFDKLKKPCEFYVVKVGEEREPISAELKAVNAIKVIARPEFEID